MASILVVEDEKDLASLLKFALEKGDHRVSIAQSGKEAAAALGLPPAKPSVKPDLIILDVIMPDLDGYTLSVRLSENEATRGIPIIVLSSKSDMEDVFRSVPNVVAFVEKPVDLGLLRKRIGELLEESRAGAGPAAPKAGILIVEDDPSQLDRYVRHLRRKGFSVEGVKTAEEGLAAAHKRAFNVILTDNVLSGKLTGLQAIEGYRKISEAVIVLMTAYPTSDMEKDALLLGAKHFLAKPLDLERVGRILDEAAAPSPRGGPGGAARA